MLTRTLYFSLPLACFLSTVPLVVALAEAEFRYHQPESEEQIIDTGPGIQPRAAIPRDVPTSPLQTITETVPITLEPVTYTPSCISLNFPQLIEDVLVTTDTVLVTIDSRSQTTTYTSPIVRYIPVVQPPTGLSKKAKIGLGVGLGLGLPICIISIIACAASA